MKKIIAIFLSLLFLTSCLYKTIIWSYYENNKEYIAEKLCINRNIKNSCCFGKCFLEKQSSDEKTKNAVVNIIKEIKEMVIADFKSIKVYTPYSISYNYIAYIQVYDFSFSKNIFEPPPVVV